ncbi:MULTISPECIES: ABC1 kinase family protein [Geobacter]|uniref:ABC1 kinase family protein n=1 Tax=Geobacter TaxID=28231 RepID=UPI00257379D0|nr:AarF/UbiB family protein [Geobacter sulfurreducens]BEH09427.1 AarF/ABC1/UbiB kinase family protein [Geobacter sulfurreducens subsp. ethanolicus]BET57309.1 AarF/ABC1/UbiB kinase family protein [Geobacter sp. 60473]
MSILIDPDKSCLLQAAPRLLQILRVLVRHKFLGALRGKNHWPPPKEVRETFEELGLTFLKFGQVLALRRDLLPDAYIDELEQLHDQLPALGIEAVRVTIEAELGEPMAAVFASFSETPLAAATIAQVHEATLHDGRHVAVKVQRPGLEAMIATDVAALTYLVSLVEKLFPRLIALDLPVLVREFANSLNRETDFSLEARSIMLFRTALADIPDLWIPDVIANYSTGNILTMEFSTGERVDCYAREHPEEMPRLIKTLVRLTLQTIFEEGLFHADPHPGNVLVLPDGKLSLLDFGMTGELDEPMRNSLTLLLEAVVKRDARGATEAYLEMAPQGSEKVNRAALMVDIKSVLHEIHRNDLADVSIGDAFDSLLRAGSRHGVHNPGEFFLLTRTFVILESMIRELDPDHDYLASFRDEISRLTAQHFSLDRIKEKTGTLAREMERLLTDAPGDTRRLLRRVAEGNLGRLQAPAVEALGGRISRNLERLTGAIISAALMVAGGLMVTAPNDAGWHHDGGQVMIIAGIIWAIIIAVKTWRRDRGRR